MLGVVTEPATRRCEWIVCRGELHAVSSGTVLCPLGGISHLETCLGCRWLEDADEDRSDPSDCHTAERLAEVSAEALRAEASLPGFRSPLSLIVELL
jgi:hypothetical protein